MQAVLSLLERHARLVTLTGPGGVGKTRLAVQTARQLTKRVADRTQRTRPARQRWTQCPPEELIVDVVAATLSIRDARGCDANRLAEYLRDKNITLVLDNCEGVIEPVATLASRLLEAAPGLRILATSQLPLGITGEVVWNVPPLTVPGPGSVAAEDVRAFSSVQLFATRAAAADPGFSIDADNAAAVAAICRRLDGVPLALELAATRIRALGPHELLHRLDDRFRLLANGTRSGPTRHRTLRALLEWSWQLLSEPQQTVLRRMAIHAEGADLTAVEALAAGDGVAAGDVAGLVADLVDRSLVVSTAGPRYRMLETVVAYGLERLRDAGELEAMQRSHADYYVRLAEQAAAALRTREQCVWLERLALEAPNLRRAMETAIGLDDADLALRLVNAMAWYWFLRGRIGEARRSIRQALALPDGTEALRVSPSAGIPDWRSRPVKPSTSDAFDVAERIDHRPTGPPRCGSSATSRPRWE